MSGGTDAYRSPSTQSTQSPFTGAMVRCFAIALVLVAFLVSGDHDFSGFLGPTLGVGLVFLSFDKQHPLSLRNLFVLYTVALFCVGIPLFSLANSLYVDMTLFVVVFLGGYTFSAVRRPHHQGDPPARRAASLSASPSQIRHAEELMLVLAGLQLLLLAVNISRYGLGGFYSGQGLIDQFTTYGKASVSGGVLQIATFLLKYSTVALVVVYVQLCLHARTAIRYRYLWLLLVGLPVLSLARSDALYGTALLVVINASARRSIDRFQSAAGVPGLADDTRAPGGAPARLAPRRTFAICATVVVAVFAALVIGGLRQTKLQPEASSSPLERSIPLLQSEFTAIQAYSQIKENDMLLRRQHGKTVVVPLIFKMLPRSLFPNKAINSGAYFMSVVRPAEFALGFALPPTLFGDAYLNFGMAGAMGACLLVGLAAARLDVGYKEARLSTLPGFLIVYANFYAVLRYPLSESLAAIILTFAVWSVLKRVLAGTGATTSSAAAPTGNVRGSVHGTRNGSAGHNGEQSPATPVEQLKVR